LINAISTQNSYAVEVWFEQNPDTLLTSEEVLKRGESGPLHYAVLRCGTGDKFKNGLKIIETLIKKGADANYKNQQDCTALHFVCFRKGGPKFDTGSQKWVRKAGDDTEQLWQCLTTTKAPSDTSIKGQSMHWEGDQTPLELYECLPILLFDSDTELKHSSIRNVPSLSRGKTETAFTPPLHRAYHRLQDYIEKDEERLVEGRAGSETRRRS
jgi:hypothetical protein